MKQIKDKQAKKVVIKKIKNKRETKKEGKQEDKKESKIAWRKIIWLVVASYATNIAALSILMIKIFYPYHRMVSFAIYGISWAIFIYALVLSLSKKYHRNKKFLSRFLAPFFVCAGLAATLWVILNIFPMNSFEISQTDKVLLSEKMNSEQVYAENYIKKLRDAKNLLIRQIQGNSLDALTPEKKTRTKELWRDFLSYFVALDEITEQYKYFYQINYLTNRALNERAFMLAYSSFLANYSSSLDLMKEVEAMPLTKTLLNDEDLDYEIPQDSYLMIEKSVIKLENLLQASAGYAFSKTINRDDLIKLKKFSEEDYKNILVRTGKNPDLGFKAAIDFFEKSMFRGWFPIQKEIAEKVGDTRIPLRSEALIDNEKIEEMGKNLLPGDMFLQRRNWYLSNAGLPGFWKHAAVYVGTLSEMDLYFSETVAKTKLTQGLKVSEYIRENFPKLYEEIKDGKKRTIEAESEGVISFTLEKSMSADYAAVLRPKVSKEEKLKALIYAFKQFGKPYDFDFDFITDNTIVCSELYYKAYPMMNYKLRLYSGRMILSANHIAQDFGEKFEAQKKLLDLVYFIDADEKNKKSFFSDLENFRKSWKRTETDVMKTLAR